MYWADLRLAADLRLLLGVYCAGASTSSSQEKKLFPIFRPKGERKTLYIIRHGESEFNAATNTGTGFSDPQIYDPKLTAKGQSQVCRPFACSSIHSLIVTTFLFHCASCKSMSALCHFAACSEVR